MKYLPILKYALLLLSVAAIILGMVADSIDLMLVWSYALIFLTIGLTIIMPLIGLLQDPKAALRSMIGLGAIVLVFGVSYALSSAEPIKLASGAMMDNVTALRFSDTALYAMYISFSAVIVSILGSEIYKSFK